MTKNSNNKCFSCIFWEDKKNTSIFKAKISSCPPGQNGPFFLGGGQDLWIHCSFICSCIEFLNNFLSSTKNIRDYCSQSLRGERRSKFSGEKKSLNKNGKIFKTVCHFSKNKSRVIGKIRFFQCHKYFFLLPVKFFSKQYLWLDLKNSNNCPIVYNINLGENVLSCVSKLVKIQKKENIFVLVLANHIFLQINYNVRDVHMWISSTDM